MTIDKQKLKALAEAVGSTGCHWGRRDHAERVMGAELSADTILALLAEIERLERDAKNDAIAYRAAIERQEEIRQERGQLKAENQMLRDEDLKWQELREQEAEIERLKTENEALRKDAERYRWLKRQRSKAWRDAAGVPMNHTDAFIDAAMAKEVQP